METAEWFASVLCSFDTSRGETAGCVRAAGFCHWDGSVAFYLLSLSRKLSMISAASFWPEVQQWVFWPRLNLKRVACVAADGFPQRAPLKFMFDFLYEITSWLGLVACPPYKPVTFNSRKVCLCDWGKKRRAARLSAKQQAESKPVSPLITSQLCFARLKLWKTTSFQSTFVVAAVFRNASAQVFFQKTNPYLLDTLWIPNLFFSV